MSIDHRSRKSVHDWQFTFNKQLWQRAGLVVARLGLCHHLTNHGSKVPPPWACGRGAMSIGGDEAHPKSVNLLGLKISMDCGPWELIAEALQQLPACPRAQTLPKPEDTPSFITGDLGGTTIFVLPFPLDLRHSFLSNLELLGIPT